MTLAIGMLLSVCVLGVLLLISHRRRVHLTELGTVSAQWLSEHHGYNRYYSDR